MTDEMKPCPFCGSSDIQMSRIGKTRARIYCHNCNASRTQRTLHSSEVDWLFDVMPKKWNTRPIEDKLHAQLAARDALIERLVEAIESGNGTRLRPRANVNAISLWWLRMNAVISEYRAMKGGEG